MGEKWGPIQKLTLRFFHFLLSSMTATF